jgi:hypothetical protein
MTEEKKVEECTTDRHECKCQKILTKFLLDTISVFLGVLLALLVLRGLTAPNFGPCPCGMKRGCPMMERRLPPPMHRAKDFRAIRMHKDHPQFGQRKDAYRENLKPDFERQVPQKPQK